MTTPNPTKLISVGMPVFNEGRHINAALESLRAQDYSNLEILVCDNGSTDDTLAICRRHADADARIRIVVATSNQGATENFRRAFRLAKGEYFMWAAGHDIWDPGLLTECAQLLGDNPMAVLAHASATWIGPKGERLSKRSGWADLSGVHPVGRFFTILWGSMNPVLGLIRTETLRHCPPMPAIVGGDLVLLSALALRGEFLHARTSNWYRREHRKEPDYAQKLKRYVSSEFAVTKSWIGRRFPLLELPLALASLVARSELRSSEKLLMLLALPPVLLLRYVVGRRNQGF